MKDQTKDDMTLKESVIDKHATYLASVLLSEPDRIQQEIERINKNQFIPLAMKKSIFDLALTKSIAFLKKAGEAIECERIS